MQLQPHLNPGMSINNAPAVSGCPLSRGLCRDTDLHEKLDFKAGELILMQDRDNVDLNTAAEDQPRLGLRGGGVVGDLSVAFINDSKV